jgi:hypothetical protein
VIYSVVTNFTDPITAHNLCITNKRYSSQLTRIALEYFSRKLKVEKEIINTTQVTMAKYNNILQNRNDILEKFKIYLLNIPHEKILDKRLKKCLNKILKKSSYFMDSNSQIFRVFFNRFISNHVANDQLFASLLDARDQMINTWQQICNCLNIVFLV